MKDVLNCALMLGVIVPPALLCARLRTTCPGLPPADLGPFHWTTAIEQVFDPAKARKAPPGRPDTAHWSCARALTAHSLGRRPDVAPILLSQPVVGTEGAVCELYLDHPLLFLNLLYLVVVDLGFYVIYLAQSSTWLIDPHWQLIPMSISVFWRVVGVKPASFPSLTTLIAPPVPASPLETCIVMSAGIQPGLCDVMWWGLGLVDLWSLHRACASCSGGSCRQKARALLGQLQPFNPLSLTPRRDIPTPTPRHHRRHPLQVHPPGRAHVVRRRGRARAAPTARHRGARAGQRLGLPIAPQLLPAGGLALRAGRGLAVRADAATELFTQHMVNRQC